MFFFESAVEDSGLEKVFETVYGKKYSYPYFFLKDHFQDTLLLFPCRNSPSEVTYQISIARRSTWY